MRRPEPSADVAVGGRDAAEHADEETDGVVSDVDGEDLARAGDDDAAARALGEVDVVHSGARGDDAAEGGDGVQERGVDLDGAAGQHERGARGVRLRRGGREEGRERRARGVEVVDAEARPQRRGEGGVRAAQEQEPWLRRARRGGCHRLGCCGRRLGVARVFSAGVATSGRQCILSLSHCLVAEKLCKVLSYRSIFIYI